MTGTQREDDFAMEFDLGNKRTQVVYVRPTGATETQTIVTFFSPALVVSRGILRRGISRDQAIDLLARNEALMFARFGIWKKDDEVMVVCSVDALLESLDPRSSNNWRWRVAHAADEYERENGGSDDF